MVLWLTLVGQSEPVAVSPSCMSVMTSANSCIELTVSPITLASMLCPLLKEMWWSDPLWWEDMDMDFVWNASCFIDDDLAGSSACITCEEQQNLLLVGSPQGAAG